jgi:hypothetical protein
MRIRLALPDRHLSPRILESVLEATTRANEAAMAAGEAGPATEAIRRGLKWKPEPFTDGEHFDLAPVAEARGWADCDDLAPWLAAEMRATGDDGARARVYRSGAKKFHVVVEDGSGQIHDPSKWAGMKDHRRSAVSGAIARPMLPLGCAGMSIAPHQGHYWCRADVPWPGAAAHIASIARALSPRRAIEKAISGAADVGAAIGADEDTNELCRAGEFVIGFDPMKLLKSAASLVPGGGMAVDLASGLLGGGKKGAAPGGAPIGPGPGGGPSEGTSWVMYQPMGAPGPTVVRMR